MKVKVTYTTEITETQARAIAAVLDQDRTCTQKEAATFLYTLGVTGLKLLRGQLKEYKTRQKKAKKITP